jgi:hypothetical protein
VSEIYNSTTDYDERRIYYTNKYPIFVESYTYIFEMLCKPRFNFNKFVEIIKSKKRKRCNENILMYDLQDIIKQQEYSIEYLI